MIFFGDVLKNHYYLKGSVVGCVFAYLFALFMSKLFGMDWVNQKEFFEPLFIVPCIFGVFSTIFFGHFADAFCQVSIPFIKTTVLPCGIFLAGVLAGTLTNSIVHAFAGRSQLDFLNFFFKPFGVICFFGIPCAIVVGNLWFFVNDFYNLKKSS
jgi:formate-dependent nitrite reductase membrane component NrfD